MTHTLTLHTPHLVQAIKDVSIFASKSYGDLAHLCLSIQPRLGKLTLTASDGKAYVARTIPLIQEKGTARASLPAKTIYIAPNDVAMLTKFIPGRGDYGNVTLEISDIQTPDKKFPVRLTLATGGSTTFYLPTDVNYPDMSAVIRKAERAKQAGVAQAGMYLPINEMARASKVLPKTNGETVAVYACKANRDSSYCLIEYQQDTHIETKIIFITACAMESDKRSNVAKAA